MILLLIRVLYVASLFKILFKVKNNQLLNILSILMQKIQIQLIEYQNILKHILNFSYKYLQ